jgi:hypothetical protein
VSVEGVVDMEVWRTNHRHALARYPHMAINVASNKGKSIIDKAEM